MSELIAALNQLEKEKGIDKDVIMEAIENSLLAACKRDFGSADNVVVNMDRETGDIYVYAIKEVVDDDLQDVLDRLDALCSDKNTYTSFSGKTDDMDGNVKFVIETAAIESDDDK